MDWSEARQHKPRSKHKHPPKYWDDPTFYCWTSGASSLNFKRFEKQHKDTVVSVIPKHTALDKTTKCRGNTDTISLGENGMPTIWTCSYGVQKNMTVPTCTCCSGTVTIRLSPRFLMRPFPNNAYNLCSGNQSRIEFPLFNFGWAGQIKKTKKKTNAKLLEYTEQKSIGLVSDNQTSHTWACICMLFRDGNVQGPLHTRCWFNNVLHLFSFFCCWSVENQYFCVFWLFKKKLNWRTVDWLFQCYSFWFSKIFNRRSTFEVFNC